MKVAILLCITVLYTTNGANIGGVHSLMVSALCGQLMLNVIAFSAFLFCAPAHTRFKTFLLFFWLDTLAGLPLFFVADIHQRWIIALGVTSVLLLLCLRHTWFTSKQYPIRAGKAYILFKKPDGGVDYLYSLINSVFSGTNATFGAGSVAFYVDGRLYKYWRDTGVFEGRAVVIDALTQYIPSHPLAKKPNLTRFIGLRYRFTRNCFVLLRESGVRWRVD